MAGEILKKREIIPLKRITGVLHRVVQQMVVAKVPENKNNKFESVKKTNKQESVPTGGYIDAIEAHVALKKQNNRSNKYNSSDTMVIDIFWLLQS